MAVDPDVYEWYEYQDWDDWEEDEEQLPVSAAMKGGDRCRQCGKAGHFAKNCSTDMSKVRCFKCGDSGHIGANCKKSPSAKGKPSPKTSPKSRANPKSKGKGSGKGGKKGKMHELAEGEVAEEEEGEWQAQEWPEDWADASEGGVMMPLICSFQETDWSWWLLDSGAAVSVLSENFCQNYKYKGGKTGVGSVEYFAANGSPVRMSQTAAVTVAFEVTTGAGAAKVQSFQLECCVGNVSHNIISTGQLVKKGWTVVQSPDEMYLYHAESQTMITEVTLWGGCPWMRSRRPTATKAIKDQPGKTMPMDVDVGGAPMDVSGLKVSAVNLDQSQAERRRQHVLKGHFPYDPHCLECQQGRGVSRAPRRPMRERVLEIQVDFFFLGTLGTLSGVSASAWLQNIAETRLASTESRSTSRPVLPVFSTLPWRLCMATTYLAHASQPARLSCRSQFSFASSSRIVAIPSFTSRTPRSTEPTESWFWGPARVTVYSLGIPLRWIKAVTSGAASVLKSIGGPSPPTKENSAKICLMWLPVTRMSSLTAVTPRRPVITWRNKTSLWVTLSGILFLISLLPRLKMI